MTRDFSLAGYRALLGGFAEARYETRSFADADAACRHLILRHDIDMSLDAAVPIAEIEADLGHRATYFVLLRTDLYNPFSVAGSRALERIGGLGHEIGLHLDAALYGVSDDALEKAAERECPILESMIGAPVNMVSFHRPAKALLGRAGTLAGRHHAYEPHFFSEMGYCSDSRGAWHHGHPLAHEAVKAGRALQLLTHPIWWPDRPQDGPVPKLVAFAAERDQLLRRELAANCEPYRAVFAQGTAKSGSSIRPAPESD